MRGRGLLRAGLGLALIGSALVASLAASCPPRVTTPEERAYARAAEAVSRLRTFQSTVIAANQLGQLADAPAIRIVRFTGTSVQLIEQTPYGWALPVKAAYDALVKDLPPEILLLYKPTLDALSSLLLTILAVPAPAPAATGS